MAETDRAGVVRVQFEMSQARAAEMAELMRRTGVSTRKELFSNALSLLMWAVGQKERGLIVAAVDEQGKTYREVVMPILETATPPRP